MLRTTKTILTGIQRLGRVMGIAVMLALTVGWVFLQNGQQPHLGAQRCRPEVEPGKPPMSVNTTTRVQNPFQERNTGREKNDLAGGEFAADDG